MFYSHLILTKKGPLGKVWMAATMGESKISKSFATTAKIHVLCKNIENPSVPFALRLSASLMLGVVRVYSKKSTIILTDVSSVLEALNRCTRSQERSKGTKRKGERSALSALPDDNDDVARFESITLPLSKKRRTRTYAPPTKSESRSQASRWTESVLHLPSSYLGETGEIDVLRAMDTLFPSIPVPRLGEHLPSSLSTPSTGYRSGNKKLMLYKAREEDITMAAPMENLDDLLDFGVFDQDLGVNNHSADPQSSGSDGLMLVDNGNAEDFAAAFGSQLESGAQKRHSNEVNRTEIAPHIPDDGHSFPERVHGLDSKENTSLASGYSHRTKSQKVTNSKKQHGETRWSKSFPEGDQTETIAKSAIKTKKTRRAARVYFDQVTELPPSHIRSCLSDANDITLDGLQSRVTETSSRRLTPELNIFDFNGTLSSYPQQIIDLWKDVTADAVNLGHAEQSLSSLRRQDQDAEADNTFTPVQEHMGASSFPFLDSPIQINQRPDHDISMLEGGRGDLIPFDDPSPQRHSTHDDVPNAEVLRDGDSNRAVMQPDLGSLSAPSHSASGPSTFSGKSNQFQRDVILDEITADDKRLYEEACFAVRAIDPDGGLHDKRHSQSPYPRRSSSGTVDNAGGLEGSPGDGRLDVRASDFELIEETEKPQENPSSGKEPLERIGIRGYKVLQMLRSEMQEKRRNSGASIEVPSNEDANIITVRRSVFLYTS